MIKNRLLTFSQTKLVETQFFFGHIYGRFGSISKLRKTFKTHLWIRSKQIKINFKITASVLFLK